MFDTSCGLVLSLNQPLASFFKKKNLQLQIFAFVHAQNSQFFIFSSRSSTTTTTMFFQHEVQPIDLDAFDQNALTLGLQGAEKSLTSSPVNSQLALPGTQLIFNISLIILLAFPIQTRFLNPLLTASGFDPLATTFPLFMAFCPALAPISIKNLIPNPAPPILPPNPTAGGETTPVTRGRRGSRGGRGGGRGGRRRGRGGNTSISANSSTNSPATPSDVLPAADRFPSINDSHKNSDPDDQTET